MVRWQWFARDVDVQLAARHVIDAAARAAIQARGAFRFVLAGGSTPRAVYESLGNLVTDWTAWHIYFGDERVLPAEHPERNSKMAQDAWLAQTSIPVQQIYSMPTERGLEPACGAYTHTLSHVGDFDLVLLGLGEDGHTASLFPGHDLGAVDSAPDVLMVHDAPKPPPQRLTLSANRLSRAHQVLFLVTGAGKQNAVARWRSGEAIPAAAIHSPNGVDVLLDDAAWPKQPSP